MRYTKEINGLKIKQTNRKKELIIILATLAIMYIIVSLFKVYESIEFQYSVVRFIRIINGLIAIISIAVGLNLYKKTKELSIYILLLVYISFAITVIFGQIDYATFLNYSFNVTNYLTITVSLLRVVILSSIIIPNSTIYKIIEKNRGKSLIFVITYSIFAWIIEKQLFVGGIFENKKTLIIYTIFLNISYLVIAIKLLLKSINKNRVILNAFSISLLIVAIKLLYITMVFKYNSFNMKLISALLTYLTFFVVVVGSVIELYLINGKVEHLNNELIKFYNLAHFNSYNYMFICDRNLNISYMNNKIKEQYGQDIDEKWYKEKILKNDGFKEKINEIQEELTKNGAWRGLVNVSNNKCIFDCYIQMIYSSENKSFNELEMLSLLKDILTSRKDKIEKYIDNSVLVTEISKQSDEFEDNMKTSKQENDDTSIENSVDSTDKNLTQDVVENKSDNELEGTQFEVSTEEKKVYDITYSNILDELKSCILKVDEKIKEYESKSSDTDNTKQLQDGDETITKDDDKIEDSKAENEIADRKEKLLGEMILVYKEFLAKENKFYTDNMNLLLQNTTNVISDLAKYTTSELTSDMKYIYLSLPDKLENNLENTNLNLNIELKELSNNLHKEIIELVNLYVKVERLYDELEVDDIKAKA